MLHYPIGRPILAADIINIVKHSKPYKWISQGLIDPFHNDATISLWKRSIVCSTIQNS